MEAKDVLLKLRTERGLSQDALAEKLFVTRQAVSRWERGDTLPNTETLKLLSKLYDVSINTLLGSPRTLICQCCGMPLDDTTISREPGGAFNEDYCKWCYTDGKFAYSSVEELLAFLVPHMSNDAWQPEQVRAYLADMLPKLKHWAKCIRQMKAAGRRVLLLFCAAWDGRSRPFGATMCSKVERAAWGRSCGSAK